MVEELLNELRRQALKEAIPVMDEDSLQFVAEFLVDNGVQSLLEVGTAIGYSAITMAAADPQLYIVTLEIDEQRHQQAWENIRKAELEERITAVLTDARQYETAKAFDVILLDGPKAHNLELLTRFEQNLKPGGWCIIDDVYFHGFIDKPQVIRTKRLRTLARRFGDFQKKLENDPRYECTRVNIGDGLLLARKKENTK